MARRVRLPRRRGVVLFICLEALVLGLEVDACINVEKPCDNGLAHVMVKFLSRLDHMRKPSVAAKLNVEVWEVLRHLQVEVTRACFRLSFKVQ